MTKRKVGPTAPERELDPWAESDAAMPLFATEQAPEPPPAAVAPPPPPVAAGPPPPPPAPAEWAPAPDPWYKEIATYSFNRSAPPGRTTPAALFGIAASDLDPVYSEKRIGAMAKWFRSQPNAPWQWIDGELKRVGNAEIRWRRIDPASRESANALTDWFKSLRDLEVELEHRIRLFLGGTAKQNENAYTLSATRTSGGALAPSERFAAPPPFDPARFVYLLGLRGVTIELDEVTRRPAFRGVAAGISPADYQAIEEFRHEIAAHIAGMTAMARASAALTVAKAI